MDRDAVVQWVAAYERAWRDGDVSRVARLFTENASYRVSPCAEPKVGHAEDPGLLAGRRGPAVLRGHRDRPAATTVAAGTASCRVARP